MFYRWSIVEGKRDAAGNWTGNQIYRWAQNEAFRRWSNGETGLTTNQQEKMSLVEKTRKDEKKWEMLRKWKGRFVKKIDLQSGWISWIKNICMEYQHRIEKKEKYIFDIDNKKILMI